MTEHESSFTEISLNIGNPTNKYQSASLRQLEQSATLPALVAEGLPQEKVRQESVGVSKSDNDDAFDWQAFSQNRTLLTWMPIVETRQSSSEVPFRVKMDYQPCLTAVGSLTTLVTAQAQPQLGQTQQQQHLVQRPKQQQLLQQQQLEQQKQQEHLQQQHLQQQLRQLNHGQDFSLLPEGQRWSMSTRTPVVLIEPRTSIAHRSQDTFGVCFVTPLNSSENARLMTDDGGGVTKVQSSSNGGSSNMNKSEKYTSVMSSAHSVSKNFVSRSQVFHYDRFASSSSSVRDQMEGSDDEGKLSEGTHQSVVAEPSECVEDLSKSFAEDMRKSFLTEPKSLDNKAQRIEYVASDSLSKQSAQVKLENSPKLITPRRHSDSTMVEDEDIKSSLCVETSHGRSLSDGDTKIDDSVLNLSNIENHTKTVEHVVLRVPLAETTSEPVPPLKSPGFMEQRQKPKKYFQTRYQTSLDQLGASSSTDIDDVFMSSEKSIDLSVHDVVLKDSCLLNASSNLSEEKIGIWSQNQKLRPSPIDKNNCDTILSELYLHSPLVVSESTERRLAIDEAQRLGQAVDHALLGKRTRSDSNVFTFPAINIDNISERGLLLKAFRFGSSGETSQDLHACSSPVRGYHPVQGAVSTPPSPLVTSPLDIRKYSPRGSSVQSRHSFTAGRGSSSPGATAAFQCHPMSSNFVVDLTQQACASMADATTSESSLLSTVTRACHMQPAAVLLSTSIAAELQSPNHLYHSTSYSPAPGVHIPETPVENTSEVDVRSASSTVVSGKPFKKKMHRQRRTPLSGTDGGHGLDDATCGCPVCGAEFSSVHGLANHMILHLPSEVAAVNDGDGSHVHLCKVCNRSFSRSDMLARHMRLHTGLRPYECDLCRQVFSRSDHLHTHQRTHTGEKPYQCAYCPYAAPRRDMVTRHMRVHSRAGGSCASDPEMTLSHRGRRRTNLICRVSSPDKLISGRAESKSMTKGCRGAGRKNRVEVTLGRLPVTTSTVAADLGIPESSSAWPLTTSTVSMAGPDASLRWVLTSRDESNEQIPKWIVTPHETVSNSRTWSSQNAESFEQSHGSPGYSAPPSACSSTLWSPPVMDSPDVFTPSTRQPKHFIWPTVVTTTDVRVVPQRGSEDLGYRTADELGPEEAAVNTQTTGN